MEIFWGLADLKKRPLVRVGSGSLAWKQAEGDKTARARSAAKGFQDPDFEEGVLDTSGYASLRSPHLQVISLRDPEACRIWILDIENAFLQADGLSRDVSLHAPGQWKPSSGHRFRQLNASPYGTTNAPAALRRSLEQYLACSAVSLAKLELQYRASASAPASYFDPCVFRRRRAN